jgi:hypothetical protein
VLPWPPQLHAGIFVHRVTGLAPGLYLLGCVDEFSEPSRTRQPVERQTDGK